MTSLLLHWLNEELSLHRKVHVLERDLCNGYLLAEILHLHGLEAHLERYTDSKELPVRVTNLELLAKAMATGGLGELKPSTKRKILMENRSAIVQLLLHLKVTLEARRKKLSVEKQKLLDVPCRVYAPRSPLKDPAREIQDVEERFVQETLKQYQPKHVRFDKHINSAVHLRRFPQAQWQAENEQLEYDEKMAAGKSQQNANSMAALRVHLIEKRTFMKEWDKQALEKWQRTQKLYLDAERDDLRLELTLEERKRRFQAARLAGIQDDAQEGIASFDKNMNRLGLGGSSGAAEEPPLRAIPASDQGALAHFHRLEERVEDLAFRPSNNLQMMKELRARRKAQLAAEKDRRLRRMKAASDAHKATTKDTLKTLDAEHDEAKGALSEKEEQVERQLAPLVLMNSAIQDAFIEANHEALEANYARLHEIGAAKRDVQDAELQQIRLDKKRKAHQQSRADCLEIIDDVVALALATATADTTPSTTTVDGADALNDESDESDDDEVQNLTDTFIRLSDVWETFSDGFCEDPRSATAATSSLSSRVETFVRAALAVSSDEQLRTVWTPLAEFRLVSLYSSDERGHAVARRVATDQSLHYMNVDELIDECVKHSYDPVKQADVAATLSARELELGGFGPKISSLRQKSSPLPESLVVDVVLAAISLCRNKPPAQKEVVETADASPSFAEESVAPDRATVVEPSEAPGCVGCLLHNFPRTAEEWKLFERLMEATSPSDIDDEAKTSRASAIEAALTGDTGQYASHIATAIVISHWQLPPETTATFPPALSPSSSGTELPSSATERKRTESSPSKRQVTPDAALTKAEAQLEAVHKRQLVEDIFSRTSRLVTIDQTDMHERVLQELIHLAVDTYSCASAREQVGMAVECLSCRELPSAMHSAREQRRSRMPLADRIAWMVATKELVLNEEDLMELVHCVQRLEDVRKTNLRRLFKAAYATLKRVTLASRTKHQELDELMSHIASQCDVTLKKVCKMLPCKPSPSEKALTAVEVELGDAIEHHRIRAKHFIDAVEEEAHCAAPPLLSLLVPWLQLVPRVGLELKEFVVDAVALLQSSLYKQLPFLRSHSAPVLPVDQQPHVLKTIDTAIECIDRACAASGLRFSFLPEAWRLVDQIATAAGSDTRPHSHAYDLAEDAIARELVAHALSRFVAVLQWSAALVVNVNATYASDVGTMRESVRWELQSSDRSVAHVIKELAATGIAKWPRPTATEFSRLPLSRRYRAAFLSTTQLETLAAELGRAEEACASPRASLTREQFVTTVFEIATRFGFPQPWQDTKALARVAMTWSSNASHACRLAWRHLVFAMLCTQFTGFPSVQHICSLVNQVANSTELLADQTLTQDDFQTRLTLWFEHDRSAQGRPTARWKTLLFSLFADRSSCNIASVLAMALTFCVSPASPSAVRSELASCALPRSSRGLGRAFAVLSQAGGASGVGIAALAQLLRHLQVAVDSGGLAAAVATHRNANDGDIQQPWRAHEAHDFVSFCTAFDPAIAHHFVVHDTFAALLNERMI